MIMSCFVVGLMGSSDALAEKRKIEIQSAIFGGLLYQLCFAFSEIVDKHSTIVALNPAESTGTGAGIMKVYGAPEKKITAGTPAAVMAAKNGVKPFNKPYPDMRIMGNFIRNIQVLITLDPNIKEMKDLNGKKVGLGPQPTVLGFSMKNIIEVGYGLKGKVKIYNMKWPQLKDTLLDGSIDVMVLGLSMRPGGKWTTVSCYNEIIAAGKKPYFIGYDKDVLEKTAKATNAYYPPQVLQKDGVAPGFPDKDILSFTDDLGIWAHKDFDPDLAYELTKVLHGHYKEMRKTTGAAKATFEEIIFNFVVPEDMVHSGTLKYLKEKGLWK